MENSSREYVSDNMEVPTCAVCLEKLGTYGGPASLACGHNGCLDCLQELQKHLSMPLCPLCRTPFDSKSIPRLNFDLKDALEKVGMTSSVRLCGSEAYSSDEPDRQHNEAFMDGKRDRCPSTDPLLQEETGPWVPLSHPHKGDGRNSSSVGCNIQKGNITMVEDHTVILPASPHPEVTLRNVLSGLFAIATGRNKPVTNPEEEQEPNSEISPQELAPNDPSTLWSTVHLPSAPPLLSGDGNNSQAVRTILEVEPPQWVPDSASSNCMQCWAPFKPFTRGRHHCRFCGGIFCGVCSAGRCLLPVKFRERDPQRVCDACYERLEPLQRFLVNRVSNAAQIATHDVTDWTCMRGWVNTPLGMSMEQDIYKSTNVLRNYCEIGRLKPERSIPDAVLRGAKGLAILTVAKAGVIVTYKLGTGLVVARREDGSWSAPSAIVSCGLGWGAQMGGELTDFVIVLRNFKAVKAFSSRVHFSLGAGLSVAAGLLGRVAEADLRAGDSGTAACYTYSSSKGAFVGVSFEGNIVSARTDTNLRFYGDPYLTPADILLGSVERPRAAAPLYSALHDLFKTLGGCY
eukprot:Gb_38623 [translate_table: standard]